MEHTFLCENDMRKATYLTTAFPQAKHIFTDMVDVGKGLAKDVKSRHGTMLGWMQVPEARLCRANGFLKGIP